MRWIFYIFLIIQLQNILGVLGQKEREKSSQLNPIKWEKVKEDLPQLKSVKWEKVKEDSPQLKSVKREKVEEKSEQLKKTIWKSSRNTLSHMGCKPHTSAICKKCATSLCKWIIYYPDFRNFFTNYIFLE